MQDVPAMIDGLETTPAILRFLLSQIPAERIRQRRIQGKWCIHEQVCHLAEAQDVLVARFRKFESEEDPYIEAYDPPEGRPESYYLDMNMDAELASFERIRAQTVSMLRGFPERYWTKQGRHAGFSPYNTRLLLTHALNVDYAHLFSIEQLGLTKPGLESGILTIP